MPAPSEGAFGGWPTLGILVADWIEHHCPIPSGFRKGQPFVMYEPQLLWTVNHYRVRPTATVGQEASAFHFRRSQIVGPQKIGKGPWSATICLNEAAGPSVFDGWAGKDDGYACIDNGCGCGWEFAYQPGDPKGIARPDAKVQLLATAEPQVDNIYGPLKSMVKKGPLGDFMRVGEEFTRVHDDGIIESVTSSAQTRLGNPIHFTMQDEVGVYTESNGMIKVAETMRRGVAGMGGRSIQTTNAWDPTENSDAQRTARLQVTDVFYYHRIPPASWSFANKVERRRLLRYVYDGALVQQGGHIDLDNIEAECLELLEKDQAQAERFYGNRLVQGLGAWMPEKLWKASERVPV